MRVHSRAVHILILMCASIWLEFGYKTIFFSSVILFIIHSEGNAMNVFRKKIAKHKLPEQSAILL